MKYLVSLQNYAICEVKFLLMNLGLGTYVGICPERLAHWFGRCLYFKGFIILISEIEYYK